MPEAEFEKKIALCDRYLAVGLSASVTSRAIYRSRPGCWKLIDRAAKGKADRSTPTTRRRREGGDVPQRRWRVADFLTLLPRLGAPDRSIARPSSLAHLQQPAALVKYVEHRRGRVGEPKPAPVVVRLRRANRYIEDRLPDVPMLQRMGVKLTVRRTASPRAIHCRSWMNWKVLAQAFPEIRTEGADSLGDLERCGVFGWHRDLGNRTVGTKPGVVHLSGIDPVSGDLTPELSRGSSLELTEQLAVGSWRWRYAVGSRQIAGCSRQYFPLVPHLAVLLFGRLRLRRIFGCSQFFRPVLYPVPIVTRLSTQNSNFLHPETLS